MLGGKDHTFFLRERRPTLSAETEALYPDTNLGWGPGLGAPSISRDRLYLLDLLADAEVSINALP